MGTEHVANKPLSVCKRMLFGGLVTICFFVALELALGWMGVRATLSERDPFVGFEASLPLFVERSLPDGLVLATAENKLAYFNPQQFPKHKAPDAYRVFCVGGSTTYGRPYNDSTSYVAWLRELLSTIDERRRWEVINAGGISYASYRVAMVVEELCQYAPDLFIVYTGHNEFLEDRTYRELREMNGMGREFSRWLHNSRIYSLAHRAVHSSAVPPRDSTRLVPAEVNTILDRSVGPDHYHRDTDHQAKVVEHFEFNLHRIVQAAERVGAKVILVTPSANVKDFSPFKSEFLRALHEKEQSQWFEWYLQATELGNQGDYVQALATLQRAQDMDAGRADLHFLKGQLLLSLGEYRDAEAAFDKAVAADICPLRATSSLRSKVEKVALLQRVPLVDFEAILRNQSLQEYGHAALGNAYFVDHVHPTLEIHRLLAIALIEALIQIGDVTPNLLWREQAISTVTREIESLVDPALQAKALTNLAQVLSWAGKRSEAGPIAAQAVSLRQEHGLPEDPESMFYLAVYLETQDLSDRAATLYQQVLEHVPNHIEARQRLATILLDQRQLEEARVQWESLIKLAPKSASYQHMLGVTYMELDHLTEAVTALEAASKLSPTDAAIEHDLNEAQQKLQGKKR